MSERYYLGSCISVVGHELRITERCLIDDLHEPVTSKFDDLMNRHEIVKAFRRERSSVTAGDILRPSDGKQDLTVLRHGNDWRGVTWFDEEEKVVWLCACGWHRSGQSGDAFHLFASLRSGNQMRPTDDDYETLIVERSERFAAFVMIDAPVLLANARAEPEIEQNLLIGLESVSIVVQRLETLEETFVAFSVKNLMPTLYQLLLVSLFRENEHLDWNFHDRLPTRELDRTRSEVCMSIVHG